LDFSVRKYSLSHASRWRRHVSYLSIESWATSVTSVLSEAGSYS